MYRYDLCEHYEGNVDVQLALFKGLYHKFNNKLYILGERISLSS